MRLCATLSVLLYALSRAPVAEAACACSPVGIPVHVDVLVPKDPMDHGLTQLRLLGDVIQLLVHGLTYNSEYWSPPVEEFRSYSYAMFSCDHGLSSLAIDVLGVGLSSRPVSAADVQYPTAYGAISQVAHHLKAASVLPGVPAFKTIIAIGHSAGSALLNFGAIVEGGERSPFAGLVLTGSLSTPIPQRTLPPRMSARDVNPLRWGALDPGYIAVPNRTIFYPTDTSTFSPRMLLLDESFSNDVGSAGVFAQTSTTGLGTTYTGSVVKIVGSEDQLFCAGTGICDDVAALTVEEQKLWPGAKSFEVVVEEGSGHDMNLDFFAQGPFNTFVRFVEQFAGL
ncbi:hypothetical protein C8R46DRAFT_1007352 [Mycena filopes]|nr:hypothetical protein C8R46DRAFT_1007352 [Mycena filopes]